MDFKILNEPKPPIWRDPRYRPATGWRRGAVGIFSIGTLILGMLPHAAGYGEPISFQVARGEWTAWLLFAAMGGALAYVAVHAFKTDHAFSGLFCVLAIAALAGISLTPPLSSIHLSIFCGLILSLLLWLGGVRAELQDFRMDLAFYGALIGSFVCPFSLGIGERIVVLSSLGALNVLFYEYVLF